MSSSKQFLTPSFAVVVNTTLSLNVDFPARIFPFKQKRFGAKKYVRPIWRQEDNSELT